MHINSVTFHLKHPLTIPMENKIHLFVSYCSVRIWPIFVSCMATMAYFRQPNRKAICAAVATGITTFYVMTAIAKRELLKQKIKADETITTEPKKTKVEVVDNIPEEIDPKNKPLLLEAIASFDLEKLYSLIDKQSKAFLFLEDLEKELPGKVILTNPPKLIDPKGGDEWLPIIIQGNAIEKVWKWILEIPFLFYDVRFAQRLFGYLSDAQFEANMAHLNAKYPEKMVEWLKWERVFWKEKIEINPTLLSTSAPYFLFPSGVNLDFVEKTFQGIFTRLYKQGRLEKSIADTSMKEVKEIINNVKERKFEDEAPANKESVEWKKYYQYLENSLIHIALLFGGSKNPINGEYIMERIFADHPLFTGYPFDEAGEEDIGDERRMVMCNDILCGYANRLKKIGDISFPTFKDTLFSICEHFDPEFDTTFPSKSSTWDKQVRLHLSNFAHKTKEGGKFSVNELLEEMDHFINGHKDQAGVLGKPGIDSSSTFNWLGFFSLNKEEKQNQTKIQNLVKILEKMRKEPLKKDNLSEKMEQVQQLFKELGKPLSEKTKSLEALYDEAVLLAKESQSKVKTAFHYNEKTAVWEKEGLVKMLLHPEVSILKKIETA